MANRFPKYEKKKTWLSNDKTILNFVITKYHDLLVYCRSINCLSLRLWQIVYLLATDKSSYFAQPHLIIIDYYDCILLVAIYLIIYAL